MKKHWAVVLPLLWVGCTPETPNPDPVPDSGTPGPVEPQGPDVVEITPATPKGTVSGQVLNTRMEPLAGATVKLTIGSATAANPFTAQTDAEGNFLLTSVPAGSQVLVTASKEGYATLRATATVPSSAGNVPINNGNANVGAIALAETQSTLRLTLLTPSGQPAVGAQAYLEAVPAGMLAFNGGPASATSSVVATPVKADVLGAVTFSRVPSPSELARIGGSGEAAGGYRLWVDPVDINGDGVVDAAGASLKLKAEDLLTSGGSRVLRLGVPSSETGGATTFGLVATNLPSLQYVKLVDGDPLKPQTELLKKPVRNLLRSGDPIYLSFNQPVARDSLLAILTDEFGREQIALTVTSDASGEVYTLAPPTTTLREGQEYNLHLRATSAASGVVKTWKGYFIVGDPRTPRPLQLATVTFRDSGPTAGVLDPGECVFVSFNQVVTPTAVQLDVSLSPNADGSGGLVFKPLPAAPPMAGTCFPAEAPLKFPVDINFNDATSRFYFIYGSGSSGFPAINPDTGGRAKVDFARFQAQDPINYYETAWGSPVPAATVLDVPVTRP